MADYDSWRNECPRCQADLRDGSGTRLIYVVDPDRDCVVAYRCPDCRVSWPRSIGEIVALTDPATLKEI